MRNGKSVTRENIFLKEKETVKNHPEGFSAGGTPVVDLSWKDRTCFP